MAQIEIFGYSLNAEDMDWLTPQAHRVLSVEECNRWQRFKVCEPKKVFLASRFLLRQLLAQRLGCSPSDIQLAMGEHGKPFIQAPLCQWQFNLSHSGDVVLIALAYGIELGIDIEQSKARDGLFDIAERVLTPTEMAHFTALDPVAQSAFFFQVWVLKESFVKLKGTGIWHDLTSLAVNTEVPAYPAASATVRACYLSAPAGFTAALAYRANGEEQCAVGQQQLHSLREIPFRGWK